MRTDRTFVCTACRIRSWPVRRCPACGETRWLGDLARTPLAELDRRRGRPSALLAGTLAVGGVAGAVASVLAFTAGHVGAAEVGAAASLASIVMGIVKIPPPEAKHAGAWQLLESPIVRARMERASRLGRVRARGTLVSPLTGRECVAWRIAGTSPSMPIDDGRAVPFTLLGAAGEGGAELEVDASIATLELALSAEERALDAPDAELAAWLTRRGVELAGPIVVREAILAPGAEVEVIGTLREEARAHGYRGHARYEVLADVPGSPLIIRSPPGAGRADGAPGPATIA